MNISAIVLAGGAGRRMGGVNKALLTVDGETFIDRQIRILSGLTDDIIVVTNDDAFRSELCSRHPHIRLTSDNRRGEGPLAGLQAGLALAKHSLALLLGCDQPNVDLGAIKLLADRLTSGAACEAALPNVGGRLQPLHAVYATRVADRVDSLLAAGERKLMALLDRISWIEVDESQWEAAGIPPLFAQDIDTPQQYEQYKLHVDADGPNRSHDHDKPQQDEIYHSPADTERPNPFRRNAVQPEEAQRLLLERTKAMNVEVVSLAESWGRRLAEPIDAPHPYPAFRRSGMDGYAVCSQDIADATPQQPAQLVAIETIACGTVPTRLIAPGQTSRIMTGGMVPEGADAVVMLEMVRPCPERPDVVLFPHPVPAGRNVADIGCEMKAGERLLHVGAEIGSAEIAVLAACGFDRVHVVRQPRIAILSTGSELLQVGEPLQPGRIRNSNSPMLEALVREAGAIPIPLGKVPDNIHAARALVEKGLSEADLLLTTGGVSVGDFDIMVDLLHRWDGRVLFNKIAMRPGSPTTAAVAADGKLLLALSGNPGACYVGFHLFAKPVIRAMGGAARPLPERFHARLAESFPKVNAYTRFIRARLEFQSGVVHVRPSGEDKSSLLTTSVGADCLIVIPPTKTGIEAGELVEVVPLN